MRDRIIVQRPSITADTNAYAPGDAVHTGALAVDVAGSGPGCYLMPPVIVSDTAITGTTFLVTVFDSDPSASTVTANSAQSIAAADDQKILGCFKLDQEALPGGCSIHYSNQIPLLVRGATDGRVYLTIMILAGTPTVSAADINMVVTSVRQV